MQILTMNEYFAICFNCQAEITLDESLYESRESISNSFQSLSSQTDRSICLRESLASQSGNLFEIICNSNSALEGPICQDCTQHLLLGMDEQLKGLEAECASYRKLLEQMKAQRTDRAYDEKSLRSKIVAMKAEKDSLMTELQKLHREEKRLSEELNNMKKELKTEKAEEHELWKQFRSNHSQLLQIEEEEEHLDQQIKYANNELEKLSTVNVLNMAFHIWEQGNFGTINGFRLGRLPHSQVEWTEINAAWGQTVLLLKILMENIEGFHLSDYKLCPLGNNSTIEVLATGDALPLYGSGGFKPFGQKKFDQGIIAFVECFCQLQRHFESQSEFRLPHRMEKDLIEDNKREYSVRMQFNSEERWTKAMKCLLVNLRWTISFIVTNKNFGFK